MFDAGSSSTTARLSPSPSWRRAPSRSQSPLSPTALALEKDQAGSLRLLLPLLLRASGAASVASPWLGTTAALLVACASPMRCHFSLLTCSFLPGQEQPDITAVLQLWPHLLIRRTFQSSHLMMQLPQRLIQRLLPHRPLMQPLMLGLLLLRCPT